MYSIIFGIVQWLVPGLPRGGIGYLFEKWRFGAGAICDGGKSILAIEGSGHAMASAGLGLSSIDIAYAIGYKAKNRTFKRGCCCRMPGNPATDRASEKGI
jgi:hypothetical protein